MHRSGCLRTLALSLLMAAGIPAAEANLLWGYSYSGAGGVSGIGYITTSSHLHNGAYAITGISGERSDIPIEYLLAPGTYPVSGGGLLTSDNQLHPGTPHLGFGGFTVSAGTDLYNVYNTGGQDYDLAGADCSPSCGSPDNLGTPVTFTASLIPSREWRVSYTGAGIVASGFLTTLATPVDGHYQIVGLNGTRNGEAMNALLLPGTYDASGGGTLFSDNLLFPDNPFLDLSGFTFHAGNDRYNVYQQLGQYYDLAGIDCAAFCGDPGHLGTAIDFTASLIPEPATTALLAIALAAFGGMRRRKPSA